MTVCTRIAPRGLGCQPQLRPPSPYISRGLDIQLAFLHSILESSGQAKPFVPPRQSNIDSDDIGRTTQLGECMMELAYTYPRLHGEALCSDPERFARLHRH